MDRLVLAEVKDGVGFITLHRPEALNTMALGRP